MSKTELVSDEALEHRLKHHLERRELPDAFLYTGNHGTLNWLTLESSQRFPVAATLTSLLKEHARSIAQRIRNCRDVVSIGAGDARKELILLEELLHFSKPRCHIVDVSSRMVDEALKTLSGLGLEITGTVAFCEDLGRLAPDWNRPVLLCLLGNSFCNFDPAGLLPLVGNNLGPADLFLLDGSMLPENEREVARWRREVERIYNSPENVRFNTAPLVRRGMDPESCGFELKLVGVDSPWGQTYRTQKRIHVLKRAVVQCGTDAVTFAAGDVIEMGFTYKYRFAQLRQCLERHGFRVAESWPDRTGGNIIILAEHATTETEP